ncbi:MAG: hypothetical protein KA965_08740 [Butyrivibrio sp.]|nr:hypothetical protein [Butyrivibrio sp.]
MNYIAIIGDMKASKKMDTRREIQVRLNAVLNQINEQYHADIAAKFIITLGDEFQGLLNRGSHLYEIIKYIQREMYPVKLRFGIGVGEINTAVISVAAIGADGPAYYAARESIEAVRAQEKKLKKQATDIKLAQYEAEHFEITEINTMLTLLKIMEENWTDKQRYTIWDMEKNGGSQEECAERMKTSQSTVARRLADGNYLSYEKAKETISEALKRIGEGNAND